jgi:hypothetical protein
MADKLFPLPHNAKRQINQRAYALGGTDYFEQCRRYLLGLIEDQMKAGLNTSPDWVEVALAAANPSDMMRRSVGNKS